MERVNPFKTSDLVSKQVTVDENVKYSDLRGSLKGKRSAYIQATSLGKSVVLYEEKSAKKPSFEAIGEVADRRLQGLEMIQTALVNEYSGHPALLRRVLQHIDEVLNSGESLRFKDLWRIDNIIAQARDLEFVEQELFKKHASDYGPDLTQARAESAYREMVRDIHVYETKGFSIKGKKKNQKHDPVRLEREFILGLKSERAASSTRALYSDDIANMFKSRPGLNAAIDKFGELLMTSDCLDHIDPNLKVSLVLFYSARVLSKITAGADDEVANALLSKFRFGYQNLETGGLEWLTKKTCGIEQKRCAALESVCDSLVRAKGLDENGKTEVDLLSQKVKDLLIQLSLHGDDIDPDDVANTFKSIDGGLKRVTWQLVKAAHDNLLELGVEGDDRRSDEPLSLEEKIEWTLVSDSNKEISHRRKASQTASPGKPFEPQRRLRKPSIIKSIEESADLPKTSQKKTFLSRRVPKGFTRTITRTLSLQAPNERRAKYKTLKQSVDERSDSPTDLLANQPTDIPFKLGETHPFFAPLKRLTSPQSLAEVRRQLPTANIGVNPSNDGSLESWQREDDAASHLSETGRSPPGSPLRSSPDSEGKAQSLEGSLPPPKRSADNSD